MATTKVTKSDSQTLIKISLSAYAQHLYAGLTVPRPSYGVFEAAHYWRSAKHADGNGIFDFDQVAFFSGQRDMTLHAMMEYIHNYKQNVENLDNFFAEYGITDATTYEELDAMKDAKAYRDARNEPLLIEQAAREFPERFSFRAFRNKVFRISVKSSYMSEGRVILYSEVYDHKTDSWQSFAKGTPEELKAEMVEVLS